MKIYIKLLFLGLIWTLSSDAFAEADCTSLLSKVLSNSTSVSKTVKIIFEESSEISTDKVVKAIDDITKFSEGIKTPDDIHLEVWPGGQYINYDPTTNQLLTAKNYVVGKLPGDFYTPGAGKWLPAPTNVTKSEEVTLTITAHEYGHAILYENIILRSQDPEFDKIPYPKIKKERVDTFNKIKDLYRELYRDNPNPARKIQLENILKEETEKLNKLQSIQSPFSGLIKPYNELFADVIAVLYTKRGDAIPEAIFDADAFKHLNPAELKKYVNDNVSGRSFLHDYSVEDISFELSNVHSNLGKARSYLWEHGLKDEINNDNNGAYLAKLLKALQEAIDDSFDQQKEFSNGEELSDHFLKILKKYFP